MTSSNAARPRLVELSHTIFDGMPSYPGLPAPRVVEHLSHEQSHGRYADGTTFAISRVDMVGNTGTYLDSPAHRFPGGADVAALPLESLVDLPAIVVAAEQDHAGPIRFDVSEAMVAAAVLVRTGWDSRWRTDRYYEPGPYLAVETASALADAGVALVGVDFSNVDDTTGDDRPVHTALLGAGVPIVEHLTGLDALPTQGARFTAVPVAIRGAVSLPVRAWATLP